MDAIPYDDIPLVKGLPLVGNLPKLPRDPLANASSLEVHGNVVQGADAERRARFHGHGPRPRGRPHEPGFHRHDGSLAGADLAANERAGWVMKESLRMYPPLTSIPRKVARDCNFCGFQIAQGTPVGMSPIHTHHMPSTWTNPHDFDLERFSPERAEHRRHAYACLPFGGGAHLCIGQHFADMEVKSVMHQVLRRFRWLVRDGYRMPHQLVPIAKPRNGLPILLQPI